MKNPSNSTTSRSAKARSGRISRDPYYQAWYERQRNPRTLCSTDEYFRRNPDAPFRIVASGPFAGKFFNFTFYPRRGIGQTIQGENLRILLAERSPNGTPRARMLAVFEAMKAEGYFPEMRR